MGHYFLDIQYDGKMCKFRYGNFVLFVKILQLQLDLAKKPLNFQQFYKDTSMNLL